MILKLPQNEIENNGRYRCAASTVEFEMKMCRIYLLLL